MRRVDKFSIGDFTGDAVIANSNSLGDASVWDRAGIDIGNCVDEHVADSLWTRVWDGCWIHVWSTVDNRARALARHYADTRD